MEKEVNKDNMEDSKKDSKESSDRATALLLFDILDVLRKYSTKEKPLSAEKIKQILKDNDEYTQKAGIKTVKRYLRYLIDTKYDVQYKVYYRKGKYGKKEELFYNWYIEKEQNFNVSEIRLMIDSLLFSKYIPNEQCLELIEKLIEITGVQYNHNLKNIRALKENYPVNEKLYTTIEILDNAITTSKKVYFNYFEYGIDKKPRVRKNKAGKTAFYIVSPYKIVATNGRYYLICNHTSYNNVTYFRLDRITNIKLLEDNSKPMRDVKGLGKDFSLPKHMAEHIYMFSGESVEIKFRAKQTFISDILDWFGFDVMLMNEPNDEVLAVVNVNEQAMFYWAMQYGEHIKIIWPLTLRKKLHEASEKMVEKYSN